VVEVPSHASLSSEHVHTNWANVNCYIALSGPLPWPDLKLHAIADNGFCYAFPFGSMEEHAAVQDIIEYKSVAALLPPEHYYTFIRHSVLLSRYSRSSASGQTLTSFAGKDGGNPQDGSKPR